MVAWPTCRCIPQHALPSLKHGGTQPTAAPTAQCGGQAQRAHQALHQRLLRPHDHKLDALLAAEGEDLAGGTGGTGSGDGGQVECGADGLAAAASVAPLRKCAQRVTTQTASAANMHSK